MERRYYRWSDSIEDFKRFRKHLFKMLKPFDPDKQLARCVKCHIAFWGKEKYCKKHYYLENKKQTRYGWYDKEGNLHKTDIRLSK